MSARVRKMGNYAWKFLNAPTNVDLSKKFIIIDLSGVPPDLAEGMNYLLTAVLSLRFNISAKQKTSIYIDEGRVFLKNPMLANDIVRYLTQARSYGIRLILATQQLSDLTHVSDEFKTNTFLNLIFGNNIYQSIDVVKDFYHLNNTDVEYLKSCNKQGQALLLVGPPYNQSYHLQMKLSPLEEQIILGKKPATDSGSLVLFLKPELEKLAEEQGVIFSDWVTGDISSLGISRTHILQQRAVGAGSSHAYIKNELIKNNMIENQHPDHYLTVCHLAGELIKRGAKVTVNHFSDADDVAELPDGRMVAFEYQTAGNNNANRLIHKRQTYENQYGIVFFVGNSESVPELKKVLHDEEIIISRGVKLEKLLDTLFSEKPEPKPTNLVVIEG